MPNSNRATDPLARRQAGWTVIELMIALVLIGVVAAIAIATLVAQHERAKQKTTMADMRIISRALEVYSVDNSALPDDSFGLPALAVTLEPYAGGQVPFTDGWGRPIRYVRDLEGNYTLESYGRDGVNQPEPGVGVSKIDRDLVMINGVFTASSETF